MQLLLEENEDVNLQTYDGDSPLHIACQNGHGRIVKLLLEKRANVNLQKRNGDSPLHVACRNGQVRNMIREKSKLKAQPC